MGKRGTTALKVLAKIPSKPINHVVFVVVFVKGATTLMSRWAPNEEAMPIARSLL